MDYFRFNDILITSKFLHERGLHFWKIGTWGALITFLKPLITVQKSPSDQPRLMPCLTTKPFLGQVMVLPEGGFELTSLLATIDI